MRSVGECLPGMILVWDDRVTCCVARWQVGSNHQYEETVPQQPYLLYNLTISYYNYGIDMVSWGKGGCSVEVKVSSKYQIVIPKAIRRGLNIEKGQRLHIAVRNGMINLIPEVDFTELKGVLKGMDTGNLREEGERLL